MISTMKLFIIYFLIISVTLFFSIEQAMEDLHGNSNKSNIQFVYQGF